MPGDGEEAGGESGRAAEEDPEALRCQEEERPKEAQGQQLEKEKTGESPEKMQKGKDGTGEIGHEPTFPNILENGGLRDVEEQENGEEDAEKTGEPEGMDEEKPKKEVDEGGADDGDDKPRTHGRNSEGRDGRWRDGRAADMDSTIAEAGMGNKRGGEKVRNSPEETSGKILNMLI